MRVIEIEDDVYEYLLRRAVRIGEDASSILRREIGLSRPDGGPTDASSGTDTEAASGLLAFVQSSEFSRQRTVTDRYLSVLGWLAHNHSPEFEERILGLGGRKRRYFGRSEDEIKQSGSSTHPQEIPGTDFWAMTNADNGQKRQMLQTAMQQLGYSQDVISTVTNAIT